MYNSVSSEWLRHSKQSSSQISAVLGHRLRSTGHFCSFTDERRCCNNLLKREQHSGFMNGCCVCLSPQRAEAGVMSSVWPHQYLTRFQGQFECQELQDHRWHHRSTSTLSLGLMCRAVQLTSHWIVSLIWMNQSNRTFALVHLFTHVKHRFPLFWSTIVVWISGCERLECCSLETRL